jgi:quercetin dioxygenase-like cupin family protein
VAVGRIEFVDAEAREFVSAKEWAARDPDVKELLAHLNDDVAESATFYHHHGTAEELELFETRWPPFARIDPHAHDVDEIIVVVQGEIRFGRKRYGVGSSVFIPSMTLYGFEAGPEGLTFLNFRPCSAARTVAKEEFRASLAESHGTTS